MQCTAGVPNLVLLFVRCNSSNNRRCLRDFASSQTRRAVYADYSQLLQLSLGSKNNSVLNFKTARTGRALFGLNEAHANATTTYSGGAA